MIPRARYFVDNKSPDDGIHIFSFIHCISDPYTVFIYTYSHLREMLNDKLQVDIRYYPTKLDTMSPITCSLIHLDTITLYVSGAQFTIKAGDTIA